jgi:integrase
LRAGSRLPEERPSDRAIHLQIRAGYPARSEAGLPPHFTPHSFRHTFASLLLQQGESPAYVQRQLGHASIKLTVDTYGKWLPMGNKAAVDRLDDSSGSNVVAIHESGRVGAAEVTELDGAGGGS